MRLLLSVGIATLVLCGIVKWLFDAVGIPFTSAAFVVILVFAVIVSIPLMVVEGFIDHAQDRADARADKLIGIEEARRIEDALDGKNHRVNVDARTLIVDQRSITINSSKEQKERKHGDEERVRRIGQGRA